MVENVRRVVVGTDTRCLDHGGQPGAMCNPTCRIVEITLVEEWPADVQRIDGPESENCGDFWCDVCPDQSDGPESENCGDFWCEVCPDQSDGDPHG